MYHNFKGKYIIVPSRNPTKPTAFPFKCISLFKNPNMTLKEFY